MAAKEDLLQIITMSERRDLKRCLFRWWWRYREGLDSRNLNEKLWFGIGIHEALAVYFGKGTRRYLSKALDVWHAYCDDDELSQAVRMRGKLEDPAEYTLARDLGAVMLKGHHETWNGSRDLDVIITEQEFSIPIPSIYSGEGLAGRFCSTFDGVARDKRHDRIVLLEHKTAANVSPRGLEVNEQGTAYNAAANLILHEMGLISKKEEIDYILWNILAKRLPDERPTNREGLSLNKDGSISKQQPAPLFYREPVYRTRGERINVMHAIASELEHIRAYKEGELPLTKNHTEDCSWDCSFYNMCLLHDQNADWEEFRDAMFQIKDPYRLAYRKAA